MSVPATILEVSAVKLTTKSPLPPRPFRVQSPVPEKEYSIGVASAAAVESSAASAVAKHYISRRIEEPPFGPCDFAIRIALSGSCPSSATASRARWFLSLSTRRLAGADETRRERLGEIRHNMPLYVGRMNEAQF